MNKYTKERATKKKKKKRKKGKKWRPYRKIKADKRTSRHTRLRFWKVSIQYGFVCTWRNWFSNFY